MSDFIQWLGTPEAHNVRHGLALLSFFLVLSLVKALWSLRGHRRRRRQERAHAQAFAQVYAQVERDYAKRSAASTALEQPPS